MEENKMEIQDEFLLDVKVLSIQYTQDQLDKVMQEHPRLTSNGFESSKSKDFERNRQELKNDLAAFQAACVYLSRVNKTKSINMVVSSYGYKHRLENMGYPYLFNGTFIAAAIHMGFKIDTRSDTPNAAFNISDPLYKKYMLR
jgi:hypothetical protein